MRRERTGSDERIAVPESEHWKFAYPGFRQAWADGNLERMNAWTPDEDLADEYDPNWKAPTDGIDEIEQTDPELADTLRWIAAEATRRYHEETHARTPALLQPEEATDSYCETVVWHRPAGYGPESMAVGGRLATSTAGWERPPTAAEFHEAVREKAPNARQRAILRVFLTEATEDEWIQGWAERAFTWRAILRHAHAIARVPDAVVGTINAFARTERDQQRRAFEAEYIDKAWRAVEQQRGSQV